MKVLLINGSPNANGCTATGIRVLKEEFERQGIETVVYHLTNVKGGCLDCSYCMRNGSCVRKDDVNEVSELLKDIDGIIVGSPVYYAGISGTLKSFLDRLFYSNPSSLFAYKAAAAFTSSRRAGNLPSLDTVLKYFTITQMTVISSNYWNDIHGSTPEQVLQDEEGITVLRQLAVNMSYYLKMRELAEKEGLPEPEQLPRVFTNFIR